MGGSTLFLFCGLAVCYPKENPFAGGGQASRSPQGEAGAFTRSSSPLLLTEGLHYTTSRFFVHTITLLNIYTSHWYLEQRHRGGLACPTEHRGRALVPTYISFKGSPCWGVGASPH